MQLKWFKFAWKNIWRNKRRSAITVGITAIGVAGLLFFGGFALFTYESLKQFAARQQGHVIMAHENYFDKEEDSPMAYSLENWQNLRGVLKEDRDVRVVLPRIAFSGLISNGDKSAIFVGTGVDSRKEFTVTGPFMNVTEGDILNPRAGEPQVMLAKGLARNLKAGIGSRLTLLVATGEGSLNGMDVEVAGIFATGIPELDKRKIIVTLPTAQFLLLTDRVSTLSVYLHSMKDTLPFQQKIQTAYPQLATRNWSDMAFFYHKVRNLYDRIFTIVGAVIVVVVLLSVVNTMSMTVVERTREIGTMEALGAMGGLITRNFMVEGAVIGLMGVVTGVFIAGALTLWLAVFEVMMPAPPGMTEGYPLRIHFSAEMYWVVALTMVTVTAAGAYVAALKGTRKPIVEALSHV